MKNYKKLYKQEVEKNTELKSQIAKLQDEAKETEPYCVDVCFDEKGENSVHIENVIKHETNYKGFPDCRAENWKITTSDGLVSVFKYDEVKCVLAYREDGTVMSTLDRIAENINKAFNGE